MDLPICGSNKQSMTSLHIVPLWVFVADRGDAFLCPSECHSTIQERDAHPRELTSPHIGKTSKTDQISDRNERSLEPAIPSVTI